MSKIIARRYRWSNCNEEDKWEHIETVLFCFRWTVCLVFPWRASKHEWHLRQIKFLLVAIMNFWQILSNSVIYFRKSSQVTSISHFSPNFVSIMIMIENQTQQVFIVENQTFLNVRLTFWSLANFEKAVFQFESPLRQTFFFLLNLHSCSFNFNSIHLQFWPNTLKGNKTNIFTMRTNELTAISPLLVPSAE